MVDFAEFVLSRTPALLRFAFLLTGDRHLAEDLTQEALVRVHQRWNRILHEDGPEAYVRKTILHLYLSWRRRLSSSELASGYLPERTDPRRFDEDILDRDEMWILLAALPRMQRAVVVLRYYEDLTDPDIARLLGCATTTVRVHAFKALKRLRTALAPLAPAGDRNE